MIPENIKTAIDEYVDNGYFTGGFLRAVFANDLFEAVFRADEYSLLCLHGICEYIYNFTPRSCWGSDRVVNDWLKLHKEVPKQTERIAATHRRQRREYGK